MKKLDELIQELCPNGVNFCAIGDVTNYEQPGKYIVKSTDYNDSYATPVLTAGQTFILGKTNETSGIYKASANSPVIIFDDFTGAFKWVDFRFKVKSSAMKLLTANEEQLSLRYLYHVMGNIGFTSDEHKRLWIATYSSFRIPIPPLPVQQEIVRILDSFTELTAELTAELAARRKQYEHYRDELLTFGDNVPKATLGEICDFKYGKGNNIPSEAGEYPVYGCNGIVSTTNVFNSEDAPIIGHIGSAGIVNWGAGKHYVTYNGTICKANPEKVLSKYVYHLLCSLHLERFVKGSQPFLSYGDFSKEIVSVPTLAEQQRVITLLDHFDTICNDLVSGLPAEIEARQKQYEYYRDKLLTFKELAV